MSEIANFEENLKKIGIFFEIREKSQFFLNLLDFYRVSSRGTKLCEIFEIENGCCRGPWFSSNLLVKKPEETRKLNRIRSNKLDFHVYHIFKKLDLNLPLPGPQPQMF